MKKYKITQSYLQIDYYEIEAENEEQARLKLGNDKPYDTQTEETETDIQEIKSEYRYIPQSFLDFVRFHLGFDEGYFSTMKQHKKEVKKMWNEVSKEQQKKYNESE